MKLGIEIQYVRSYETAEPSGFHSIVPAYWAIYFTIPWRVGGRWGWKCKVWRWRA